MKFRKKFLAFIMSLVMFLQFITALTVLTYAHNSMLDVDYDHCQENLNGDGIKEMWYVLQDDTYNIHYPHEAATITYRFVDDPAAGYSWTPNGKAEAVGEEIKAVYAASMKKWNNVYFYSYNTDGTITKNKLINIVEITQGDANITIFPATTAELGGAAAVTSTGSGWLIENETVLHIHAPAWTMRVNIDAFYDDSPLASLAELSSADISLIKANTGAHEIGHVLGLLDLDDDNLCNADEPVWHHHEVLMGYGEPVNQRSANITYKDIAGVAITRGFHTDNDHKWLNDGVQGDGKYKLICSICNGVKNVDSLIGYTYETYGACENNHTLSSGNMMAVASYGTEDYYKCKYCRYVAPFDSNVTQNYNKTYHNDTLHKCVNIIEGLEYSFYEEHNNDKFTYLNNFSHKRSCDCGINQRIESHSIYATDIIGGNFAPCMGCGHMLDLRDDHYSTIMSNITHTSINGSYILPSGIVVLVDEDIQAYLDGTLVFYPPNNVPTTQ